MRSNRKPPVRAYADRKTPMFYESLSVHLLTQVLAILTGLGHTLFLPMSPRNAHRWTLEEAGFALRMRCSHDISIARLHSRSTVAILFAD